MIEGEVCIDLPLRPLTAASPRRLLMRRLAWPDLDKVKLPRYAITKWRARKIRRHGAESGIHGHLTSVKLLASLLVTFVIEEDGQVSSHHTRRGRRNWIKMSPSVFARPPANCIKGTALGVDEGAE